MRHLTWLAFLVVTNFFILGTAEASRILFIGALGSKSHKNFYMGIINEIVEDGHHVTLVTPYASKKAQPNIREVIVESGDFSRYNYNRFEESIFSTVSKLNDYFSLCGNTMDELKGLEDETFDLVLLSTFFTDCYLSLIYKLKVPFIYVSPLGLLSNHAVALGNPIFPSIVSLPIFDHVHPLTFGQRTINVIAETLGDLIVTRAMVQMIESDCRSRGLCPADMPSFAELQRNASLIFLNSVQALEVPPRAYLQNVVHAGGIHCRPGKPLPDDLEKWVEGAGEDGFIFFSLGSTVTPSDMPEKTRKILLNVFGSLKQRVLWKWNMDSMPDMPPNVRLGKWLPQQDILSHPKLRLFITHGGLLSTYESMYHGKPVVALPVFADQKPNMKEVERQGWGKMILWEDLSEEELLEKINIVMNDEKMYQIVKERSIMMRDQPVSSKSLVTFWTDYVIRHRGAKHLHSPLAEMTWIQTYNVDVWAMLTTIIILCFWIFVKCCRFVITCCFGRKSKSKKD